MPFSAPSSDQRKPHGLFAGFAGPQGGTRTGNRATRRQERADAVSQVKALMSEYGLTMADLAAKGASKQPRRRRPRGGKVAVWYRNAATGDTWGAVAACNPSGSRPRWPRGARSRNSPSASANTAILGAPRRKKPPLGRFSGVFTGRRLSVAPDPPAFIHDLLARVDIVDVVGRHIALGRLRRRARASGCAPSTARRRRASPSARRARPTTASAAACTATRSAS